MFRLKVDRRRCNWPLARQQCQVGSDLPGCCAARKPGKAPLSGGGFKSGEPIR